MIFFFKQKTAYEMRISDWSSDVCSSDLRDHQIAVFADQFLAGHNIVDGGLKTLPHRHRAVSGGQAALAHVFEQVTVPLGNDQPVDNDAVGVQFGWAHQAVPFCQRFMRRIVCRRFGASICLGALATGCKNDRGIAESVKPRQRAMSGTPCPSEEHTSELQSLMPNSYA